MDERQQYERYADYCVKVGAPVPTIERWRTLRDISPQWSSRSVQPRCSNGRPVVMDKAQSSVVIKMPVTEATGFEIFCLQDQEAVLQLRSVRRELITVLFGLGVLVGCSR
jgi:hypothetical protein